MKKYNWGILGPGKIARKFAHDLAFSQRGNLYAIASQSEERLRAFSRDFLVTRTYNAYESLLEDPDVDVVYIAFPHSHHYSWILRCLDYGKNVLCEKPLCINARQVQKVMERQQQTGLFVMEAMWTRFLPAYIHLRKELEDHGQPVLSLSADFCYHSPRGAVERVYEPALAGGSLLDIGIYPLFLALDLIGNPESIQTSGLVNKGVDVRMAALLSYDQGRTAMIYSDVQSSAPMNAVIRLENQAIEISDRWHCMDQYSIVAGNKTIVHEYPKIGWGYYHEAEHVHDCLENGLNQSTLYPLTQSYNLTAHMDDIREKLGLQYPETIEDI